MQRSDNHALILKANGEISYLELDNFKLPFLELAACSVRSPMNTYLTCKEFNISAEGQNYIQPN